MSSFKEIANPHLIITGPFNAVSKCTKCGFDDISTQYCCKYVNSANNCDAYTEEKIIQEHIDRRCQRCHYHWRESVLP